MVAFSFRSFSILLLFGVLLGSSLNSIGQTSIVVKDPKGQTIPGVHVTFQTIGDQSKTILSDVNGMVSIPISSNPNQPLAIELSYVGYLKQRDTITQGEQISIQLQPDDVVLNQVVITGQYAPNSPEKSINKVKIISRKEMDARGVVNLSDALQFETNMRISQDNILGSSVSVQGMSGENVKIMVDGVPMVGRQNGNIDLNQINLNNIERIEIIEGPLSVNYGTNALAGTINLITKKNQSKRYQVGINTYYESVGQYNIDGSLGYQKGKHQVQVAGGRNFFNGWSPNEPYSFIPEARPADTNRNLQWNPKEQFFINGQYTFRHKESSVRLFGDYFNETIVNRGSPRSPVFETAFDEYFETMRSMSGFDLSTKLTKNKRLNILASYNTYTQQKTTYFKNLTTLDEYLSTNPEDHDTSKFENWMSRGSIIHSAKSTNLDWELGYDVNHEVAFGKRITDQKQEMGDYALYGSFEYTALKTMIIKPGLRYAYNTSYNAPLIPSLNIKYQLNRFTFRGSYAKGFRAPSLKELYFEFVDVNHKIYGNQDLKAETSNNFQIDVNYKWLKNQTLTNFQVGFFYNQISDMISLAQVSNSVNYSYVNFGNYQTRGLDLSVENSYEHLKTSVGFTYTGRLAEVEDTAVSGDMRYSPELRASVLYEFKRINGSISLFYKYNGVLPVYSISETGSVTERSTEAYQMIDLTATKFLFQKKLNFSFGVKNLLDVQNISTTNAVGGIHNSSSGMVPISWGRTFFASLKINLGWK